MYHEMENGICKTCGYQIKAAAQDPPPTAPDTDASDSKKPTNTPPDTDTPESTPPLTESTQPSGSSVPETEVNEAEKASSPDIVTVLLLCGVCFAAAILITSGILNRRPSKKEPKH
jgi:hypothetical protein